MIKKNKGFFLVSLWTCVAIGAVCCVAITSKAHKVTIREMRDRAYVETIRRTKKMGSNVKQGLKTNIFYCMNIIPASLKLPASPKGFAGHGRRTRRHGTPKARKKKCLPVNEKCVVAPKKEEDPVGAVNKYYVNSYIRPIVFCLRSIENLSYERNVYRGEWDKLRKLHDESEKVCKAYFPSGKKG